MKKITYLLVMLTTMLTVLLSLSSCEKMGENDGVRGFWRLVSVKTGDVETDVTNDNIFWGLQNGIISIRSSNVAFSSLSNGEKCFELIGRYSVNGEKVYIEELFYHYDSHDDVIPEITEVLSKYGIDKLKPNYSKKKSGNTLVLEYENGTLHLLEN